ncbi:Xylose operon regulatory protein [Rosistilla carotiformis]|uniref:Xylose operon regulatory protein n=1 Tax=Rosistilla carotiformis TaxID=2528017 RepID=A0A518JNF9_9BACT|nr:substrate-binding domain-containing protein [Rosistilla carotiformis]QDV67086.1 Xylose operon regulatory protein [Rosistilla carotiformis]
MIQRIPAFLDRCRIALLILNESHWSRSVLDGIARYAGEHCGWDFWLQPRGLKEPPKLPEDWCGDGVIARISNEPLRESIARHGLPTVNVSWHGTHCREFPKVISDPQACGRLAAEFFIGRGFEQVGYIGPPDCYNYRDEVWPEVDRVAEEAGCQAYKFDPDPNSPQPDYDFQRLRLVQWIRSLPKPVGIVAWNTTLAREIMLTCGAEGICVPDEVAILAVESDPLVSNLSPMPISQIEQRMEQVGYEAAQELQRLIAGGEPHEKPILIAPAGVIEKPSTDTEFATDVLVQQAVSFIKRHCDEAITVSDITDHLDISRRSLEERFRKALKRSPAEEIRFARVRVLKDLLRRTTMTHAEISVEASFSCENAMFRFFKRMTGLTPGEFRRNQSIDLPMFPETL